MLEPLAICIVSDIPSAWVGPLSACPENNDGVRLCTDFDLPVTWEDDVYWLDGASNDDMCDVAGCGVKITPEYAQELLHRIDLCRSTQALATKHGHEPPYWLAWWDGAVDFYSVEMGDHECRANMECAQCYAYVMPGKEGEVYWRALVKHTSVRFITASVHEADLKALAKGVDDGKQE